jgi:hypothetical protein
VAAALRGGGAVVRELRKGGAQGGEEVLMSLYRVEEEGEEARKAVGGGARRGRRRSSSGLVGGALTRASSHVFECGKALREAGVTGNSTVGSRRQLWLRVNGTTAGGGRRTSHMTVMTLGVTDT